MQGKYYISNLGRVYNIFSNIFLKPVETNNGYFRYAIQRNDGSTRYYLIHRIVMIEFHTIDNYADMQVNHENGRKLDNADDNLEWCTASENISHAFKTGLKSQYKGEDCSWATITNEQAEKVAQLICEQKYSQKEISDIVGCPIHIVGNISTGTTWKWVYDKYNLENYKKSISKMPDEDLHKLCKYFEDHCNEYTIKSDLYRNALNDLFGIEYTQNMSASMSRFYNHKTRTDITNKYNY